MKEKYVFFFLRKIDSTFFILKRIDIVELKSNIVTIDKKSFDVDITKPFLTRVVTKMLFFHYVEHIFYIDYDNANQIMNDTKVTRQIMSPESLKFAITNHIMSDLGSSDKSEKDLNIWTKVFLIAFGITLGCIICYFYLQKTYLMLPID